MYQDSAETGTMSGKSTPDKNWSQIFIANFGHLKQEEILAYFNQYGNVNKLKFGSSRNKTQTSYGHIVFSDIVTAEKVLEDRPHSINQQNIICRPTWNQPYVSGEDTRKWQIFVNGFSSRVSVKSMRQYFTQFGEVYDVALKERPINERRNGQAYVTFTQRDTVEKTLAVQKHSIDGCNVHCQRVFTLLELRARVPNNENRENWSKGKNYRDQPRCALTDDRPENISKSTEHVMALPPKSHVTNVNRGNGAIYSVSSTPVPPELNKMAGVQIEEIPSVGRGRGLHLHLMKLRVDRETIQTPTVPRVETAPDWDQLTTNVSGEILKTQRSSKTPSDQPAAIFSLGAHCASNRTIVFNSGNENSTARSANSVFPTPPPSSGRGKYVAMLSQITSN